MIDNNNNNEYYYVDCFYYGFYIKKDELKKYNLVPEQLEKKSEIKITIDPPNNSSILRNEIYSAQSNNTHRNSTLPDKSFRYCFITILYKLYTLLTLV